MILQKTESNQEVKQKIPKEQIYYHRNDIGHLNEYYQERRKLRQEYDAIQKALEKNSTALRDIDVDYNSLNANSLLDSFPLEHQNFNESLNINESDTKQNSNITDTIANTEVR